jgi:ubiquinone/menaquinone biosynthesis C-methylase UbiE
MKTLAMVLISTALSAQVADKANERYRTLEGRQGMLGNLGAADRAERIKGATIINALKLKPGMAVADLGTGAGAMLPLLSAAVTPTGRVFAQDIFPDFLERAKAQAQSLPNITFILGTDRDAKLPAASTDVALTVDAYHHYDYPAQMLASIRKGLKPNGRFVIVDYFKREGAMTGANAVEHIRLDQADVIREVEANGFRLLETIEHDPGKQYILVFTPKS